MVPDKKFAAIVFVNGDGVSPDDFTKMAARSFLSLSGPDPDYSTPSSTWSVYTGTYEDAFFIGPMEVTQPEGNKLHLKLPKLGQETDLFQYAGDLFYVSQDGYIVNTFTFFRGEQGDAGPAEYIVNRAGVGKRKP